MYKRLPRVRRRWQLGLGAAAALLAAAGLQFFDANPATSQSLFLTAYSAGSDPGLDPADGVWKNAVPVQVPLTAQAGTYAAGGGSIPTVSAKALHYQGKLYVRVEWADTTKDESTTKVENFSDAVAVEFPAKSAASVPALCMGQADAGVNIWQWRADSQAGIKDPVDVYAGALVDMYPTKDTLFYTARAAGNPYANPDQGPVQTLVSQTFGTLTIANVQDVRGQGAWNNGNWAVVFTRSYAGADPSQAAFADGATTDMAFAVWNGSEGDRNGRKSVSAFVRLTISGTDLGAGGGDNTLAIALAVALLGGTVVIGAGLAISGYREKAAR
ncbi:MAG: hypothetical protein IT304_05240 [Dehalococcoidia bacterium]|nr:hypothetical protein [Dehalococcoidia bacterium]